MLTSRGWWFLVLALILLAFVVIAGETTLLLVTFTLVLWFFWEWLLFALRSRLVVREMRLERTMRDDRGPVDTLWAGRTFHMRLALRLPVSVGLPYVRMADRVPFGLASVAGEPQAEGEVTTEHGLELAYSVRCAGPGRARFEGVRLELADLQGFFYHATFIPGVATYKVLPSLVDAEGHAASVKRHNLLPSPGHHRFRRPGTGSELLDLRDYLPGDPPKTIAWKISARRDRLITKEYESEVPVRCTLFVDTSHSVRLGPPGQNALSRLVEIAAAVAQAAAGSRDLTGLCVFDEQRVATYIRPARTKRHLIQLFHVLADATGLAPATGEARAHVLLPLAYAFAQEVYPYLLRPEINVVPFWLPWLWWQPASVTQRSGIAGRLRRYFPALFAAKRRRQARWRKRLAALLSVRYGLAPCGLAQLLEDDEAMACFLQRFLADHHVPYPLPLYDRRGRYLFASPGKVDVLARALVRAVGKGHDNELFVLLVDVLELTEQLGPLLQAVRVALARHHQVVVVCPWPATIPPPTGRLSAIGHRPSAIGLGGESPAVGGGPLAAGGQPAAENRQPLADLHDATTVRFHQAYQRLRRVFGRLRVPVVCAQSGDAAQLLLDRMDRLRALGRRR